VRLVLKGVRCIIKHRKERVGQREKKERIGAQLNITLKGIKRGLELQRDDYSMGLGDDGSLAWGHDK